MGHIVAKSVYQSLQQRLDQMWVGGPAHQAFLEILRLLFNEEEAQIASRMPVRFATIETLQQRTGKDTAFLKSRLDNMAQKGLVIDLQNESGRIYYVLLPTVIGFFEFTMMRARHDFDQKRLSELYEAYMLKDPLNTFLQQALQKETQLVRTLVHEDVLEPEVYAEVLDYEKATYILQHASKHAVSLCHCRHVKLHVGEACEHPLRMCLTLGNGVDYFLRHGLAEPISSSEALDILVQAREMGMVQIADNIKNNLGFICNCCKCSCSILEGFRRIRPESKMTYSSNFVSVVAAEKCVGCGQCVKVCPVDCIQMEEIAGKKMVAVDATRCLGCGVCIRSCRKAALKMEKRDRRVFTPESSLERILVMSLERQKLQNLLFDEIESLPSRALNQIFGWLLRQKSIHQYLLKENIRSKWIEFVLTHVGDKS
jgi:NAD-dependent dihydropyrimidine dehydrogenase PreA subunit/flagellar biosynthesis/type III secretory pathway chaperone